MREQSCGSRERTSHAQEPRPRLYCTLPSPKPAGPVGRQHFLCLAAKSGSSYFAQRAAEKEPQKMSGSRKWALALRHGDQEKRKRQIGEIQIGEICFAGAADIAALRGRIRPGANQGTKLGSKHAVFSIRPNRGWFVEQWNNGCKTRASGRHGKPHARRGPSALPAKPK